MIPDSLRRCSDAIFCQIFGEENFKIMTLVPGRMVLDKEIQKKGMILPFSANIYRPMLDR
jgi:hypothetical protein